MRTIAVFLVVFFHAWPHWVRGGFIGVDIFFVISGYLITSILLKDLSNGNYSILNFYSRRIRRIFPALFIVIASTLVFGWYILLRTEFVVLGKHSASGAGFIANLIFWSETGYFDAESTTKPLLHLWSLGVEEQFYIVWPILLWSLTKWRFSLQKVILVALLASFAYCLYVTSHNPTAAYFSPLSRFWELAVGGLCACNIKEQQQKTSKFLADIGTFIGLVLIAVTVIKITDQTPFPGWWALAPVIGTALILQTGGYSRLGSIALSSKIMVRLGLVSYPFYLWHWPLLSYAYIVGGERPTAMLKVAMIVSSLILATATYFVIERPTQRIQARDKAVAVLAGAMTCLALFGGATYIGIISPRQQDSAVDHYLRALNDVQYPTPSMIPLHYQGSLFQQLNGNGNGATIFLGDSVVEQYGLYATEFLKREPESRAKIIFATAGGCPPIQRVIRLPQLKFLHCTKTIDHGMTLAESSEVDTVVIGASWYGYFNSTYDEMTIDGYSFPNRVAQDLAYDQIRSSLEKLVKLGKRVYFVMPPPSGSAFDPRSMIDGSRFGQMHVRKSIPTFSLSVFEQRNHEARLRLLTIAKESKVNLIEPTDSLCKEQACPVVDTNGEPIYTDSVHMRPKFSISGASYLEPALRSIGHHTNF